MAYNEFAYFYDEFNEDANYEALYKYISRQFQFHGIVSGIVADLGCGTGDLTLMLAQAGYDVIGIDQSEEMLSVLRDKADQLNLSEHLLLLCQDLLHLDLYGTIRAAVSTFDTLNHIGPSEKFEEAIRNAAFFMEEGGVFVFDLNTLYKHQKVLGNETFTFEDDDASCVWKNHYDSEAARVDIEIDIHDKLTGENYVEAFCEYSYELDYVRSVLEKHGFRLEDVADGEAFRSLGPKSQRCIFTAVKLYTQAENDK